MRKALLLVIIISIFPACSAKQEDEQIPCQLISEVLCQMLDDAITFEKKSDAKLFKIWPIINYSSIVDELEFDDTRNPSLVAPKDMERFIRNGFADEPSNKRFLKTIKSAHDASYVFPWYAQYLVDQFQAGRLNAAQCEAGSRYVERQMASDLKMMSISRGSNKTEKTAQNAFRVTVENPGVSYCIVYDKVYGPIMDRIVSVKGLEKSFCICRKGRVDIYLFCTREANKQEVSRLVIDKLNKAQRHLPKTATKPIFEDVTGQEIYFPSLLGFHIVESSCVQIDLKEAGKLGLTQKMIIDVCRETLKSGNAIDEVFIDLPQGKKIKVIDVATVEPQLPEIILDRKILKNKDFPEVIDMEP